MSTLAERLQELMDACGLRTRAELAQLAGVSPGRVSQWFSGGTEIGSTPLANLSARTQYAAALLKNGTLPKFHAGSPSYLSPEAIEIAQMWSRSTADVRGAVRVLLMAGDMVANPPKRSDYPATRKNHP